jgi:hypothetical protein
MNSKKISFASLALLSCLFADQSLAATSATAHAVTTAASTQEFQLLPVLDVWGYTGKHTLGDGQVLVPLIGDQNKVFYVAAEGKVASKHNGWMAGGGLGYRQVIEQRIYGAYVTADQNNALDSRRFLVINPGIETLGMAWDFRVNGYFPTKRTWDEHSQFIDFEDHCGIYNDVHFEGHKQFDRQNLVTTDGKTIAGLGADAEIGRTIPVIDNLKAFVGGYYFNNKDAGHVGGASARITWQATNNLGVEVIDTYDNQRRNTALLGIKLSLGGFGKDDVKKFGISARLMDPIEHNIATAANGYTVPMLQDTKIRFHKFGAEILEHDNIWFFKQGTAVGTNGTSTPAAAGDGTFENPFVGFNQSNVTVVNNSYGNIGAIKDKYPLLYFAPGTYSLTGQDFPTNGRFSLPLGWGMYGRNIGYNAPAFGDERALFEGGIDIMPAATLTQDTSDNSAFVTTLNSIHVSNDQGNNVLNNNFNNAAVFIQNAGNVVVKNSFFENKVTTLPLDPGSLSDAIGTYIENSTLNFEKLDCKHDGETTIDGNSSYGRGLGIAAFTQAPATTSSQLAQNSNETTTINFNNGNNTVLAESSSSSIATSVFGAGIYAFVNNTTDDATFNFNLNFNNGKNEIISTGSNNITTYGINISTNVYNSSTSNTTIQFNDGDNKVQANGYRIIQAIHQYLSSFSALNKASMDIDFNGGTNAVLGSTSNPIFGYEGIYDAISASSGNQTQSDTMSINFNGGKNSVTLTGTPSNNLGEGIFATAQSPSKVFINFNGGENNIAAVVYGMYLYGNVDVAFNGGINTISALNGYALNAQGDQNNKINIIFSGGENTFIASTNSNTTAIYSTAFDQNGVTIQFANDGKDKVKFISNVTSPSGTRRGITANSKTNIIDKNGNKITTADGFTNVADFISKTTIKTAGNEAVQWAGNGPFNIDWIPQE